MAGRFYLVFSTAPPRQSGALAEKIVGSGLAACVNVVPGITSHYVWKGKKIKSREGLLVIKIAAANLARLTRFIEQNHPYEVPEIIALPFSRGSRAYLRWLSESAR
ncbi:MAG TPA: divalent-cation tolerance protein CutA [Elusimicrobiota bacterium]|nr:divalent-cation tolerance protein CutA [Elusimicrobiota bacterium]